MLKIKNRYWRFLIEETERYGKIINQDAGMVKLADTHGLGPCAERRGGASPSTRTIKTSVFTPEGFLPEAREDYSWSRIALLLLCRRLR